MSMKQIAILVVFTLMLLGCEQGNSDINLEEIYKEEGLIQEDSSIFESPEDVVVESDVKVGKPLETTITEDKNDDKSISDNGSNDKNTSTKIDDISNDNNSDDESIDAPLSATDEIVPSKSIVSKHSGIALIRTISYHSKSTGRRKGEMRDINSLSLYEFDTYVDIKINQEVHYDGLPGGYGKIISVVTEKVNTASTMGGVRTGSEIYKGEYLGIIKKSRNSGSGYRGNLVDKNNLKTYEFLWDKPLFPSDEVVFKKEGNKAIIQRFYGKR